MKLQQKLSNTKLKLENDIHILQNCVTSVSEEIDNYKLENDKLRKKVNSLKIASSTGEGRLYDSKLIYNQYYLGNWIIGLIIIYLIYKNIRYFIKSKTYNLRLLSHKGNEHPRLGMVYKEG